MRFDLLDVVRDRLKDASIADVVTTLPDSTKHPEAVVVSLGVASRQTRYHDGEVATTLRLTVIAKRRSELDAMGDAMEAERVVRTRSLDSRNGSYRVASVETAFPRPIPWDESGFFVWAFDATINITRKEFG